MNVCCYFDSDVLQNRIARKLQVARCYLRFIVFDEFGGIVQNVAFLL